MTTPKILVTGGSGFIGAGLVKALVKSGAKVRVLDDNSRGRARRLTEVEKDIELVDGDVRNAEVVERAAQGMDEVHHLAFVNGTELFYSQPDLVLDVGVRGMINVIDACRKQKVGTLILASSSEVYQTPPHVPTDETAPLSIPDPLNPRYSYAGGKLISELMAINYGRKYLDRVLIFRPHNVYGPDMGVEHVIPQFALRMKQLGPQQPGSHLQFKIQGTGEETRSFCFIDDLIAGVMIMRAHGDHLGIYHIGTTEEVTIAHLARCIADIADNEIDIVPGERQPGGTMRRCPDISKLAKLGYSPRVLLNDGLEPTVDWYWRNADLLDQRQET